jgi:2,4-dienoyl-CoA reductase-like NADH-dependent reductase (Old Yellow Enzyme family)
MAQYDALLTPLTVKHLRIRNRIVSTAHAPAYAEDGMPKERYQLYHEEKAKGGIGLTIFGGSSTVSVDCPATFGQISMADDRVVPYLQEFSERIHKHGAAIWCQITHMGRRTRWDSGDWLPPVAPSRVREPENRSFPKEIEESDIVRIIHDFGQAARRCKDGGLDGVELSYSSSHLIAQFWSSGINRRMDKYGGSLDDRMLFSTEVLEEVRKQVGNDFIVGTRISGDEMIDDGLDQEECLEIARRIARSGLVDYIGVMGGVARDFRTGAITMPNMSFPSAPFLYLASAIKAEVDIPVIHAGRINDLATAARAVEEGHVDLVAMTRAHMADPHIVEKLMEGKPENIRECVGANYCSDRIYMAGHSLCIHNAATGREMTMPHVVSRTSGSQRRIVVVGGGPAGLEAARVSAARGHDVVLFEAEERTGGQMNIAARATWRKSLSGITRWLDKEVRRLAVDLRMQTEATPEDIIEEAPDIVIVATGGCPNKGSFEGVDLSVSTWDILKGVEKPGERALLYDDNGSHQGPSCAEFMATRGALVELAFPDRLMGSEIGATNFPSHLRELYKLDVIITPDLRLVKIHQKNNALVAVLQNVYSLQEEERLVDMVVCEHGTLPREDNIYFALKPMSRNLGEIDLRALISGMRQDTVHNSEGRFQLFRVGDAVASRNIHAAIYDSLRLCKNF